MLAGSTCFPVGKRIAIIKKKEKKKKVITVVSFQFAQVSYMPDITKKNFGLSKTPL